MLASGAGPKQSLLSGLTRHQGSLFQCMSAPDPLTLGGTSGTLEGEWTLALPKVQGSWAVAECTQAASCSKHVQLQGTCPAVATTSGPTCPALGSQCPLTCVPLAIDGKDNGMEWCV